MKITTLIAAAALATVSTVAVADVTTPTGELVIIEKNQAPEILPLLIVGGTAVTIIAVAAGGGS